MADKGAFIFHTMENLLAHCATYLPANMPLLFSVAIAGLVGSVSHCSVMCSPLVAAQMMRLDTLEKPQSFIGYYHGGRIVTYMMLAGVAVSFSQLLFAGVVQHYTQLLLVLAGVLFVASAISPKKTHSCCSGKMKRIQQWLELMAWQRAGYFLRGMLMGLMPCGMVYAVLIALSASATPIEGALVMGVFGVTTLPALQLAGWGALKLGKKSPRLSAQISRGALALNGLFLCAIGTNLVSVSN